MYEEDWDAEMAIENSGTTQPTFVKPPVPATMSTSSAKTYDDNNNTSKFGSSFGSNSNNNYNGSNTGGFGSNNRSNFGSNRQQGNNNNDYQSSSSRNNTGGSSSSNQITEIVNVEVRSLGLLIGKAGANINEIRDQCEVKIFVPKREDVQYERYAEIKIIGSNQQNVSKAKEMIVTSTSSDSRTHQQSSGGFGTSSDSRTHHQSGGFGQPSTGGYRNLEATSGTGAINKENNTVSSFGEKRSFGSNASKNNEDSSDNKESTEKAGTINWDAIHREPTLNMSKWKDHPPVVKDFYVEDPEIKAMTRDQVKAWRAANFNIMVELFKKEHLTYTLSSQRIEDEKRKLEEKTPEEIENLLFEKIPNPVHSIEQAFRNYPEILEQCQKQKFIKPTPIQSQLWPILLKGLDCIGIAQTGTGKTLAFLLPALIHIDNQITPRDKRIGPSVLVLSPTRELAVQIEHEVKKINYKGIKSVCVYGGADRKEQSDMCTRGVDIVIATPGRLYDLMCAGIVNMTTVTFLVLDEADRMLDMGFEPQIMKILLDIRPDRQTVMTSATWPPGVRRLATKYLCEPIQLYVGSLDLRAAKTVTQKLEMMNSDEEKKPMLFSYIETEMTSKDKLLVFVGRKSTADNLSCDLAMRRVECQCIHGDREQLDREEALEAFKLGEVRILIATDLASRGIDVLDITCVINYDFPRNIEDYVHRVGRTGRAGRQGQSITFMIREDWKHAKELIPILTQGEQLVPQSLLDMAERYEKMLEKRRLEMESFGGSGRGGRGFNGGGFGFGGGTKIETDTTVPKRYGFGDSGDRRRDRSKDHGDGPSTFGNRRRDNDNRGGRSSSNNRGGLFF